jgi:hypothetical protein
MEDHGGIRTPGSHHGKFRDKNDDQYGFLLRRNEGWPSGNESQVGGLSRTTEANPEEIKSAAKNQEVPYEVTAVDTIGTREDGYGPRHLAVWYRRQPKKQNQGNSGSRQKVDRCPRTIDPPCRSFTAQGPQS